MARPWTFDDIFKRLEFAAIDYQIMREKKTKHLHKAVGDSRCLMCGTIYYNCRAHVLGACPKCSGHLRQCPADELRLSGRHSDRA